MAFLIFQASFDSTSVISVTVLKTSVEFYSAQVTMHTLHYLTQHYPTWIQSYNGAKMQVECTYT